MITVSFFKNKDNDITGFRCIGHAGYSEYGCDIICAGVSSLVINTINSLEKFTNTKFSKTKTNEKKGVIDVSFDGVLDHDAELLMRSLVLGLTEIQNDYGADYISIFFKEV